MALFGLPVNECSLSEFENLPLPEYREQLDLAKQALISDGQPFLIDYKIRRKADGTVITVRAVAEYDPESQVIFCAVHEVAGVL